MYNAQLGGRIGPFVDPATGQSVNGTVHGTFTYVVQGDPNAAVAWLQSALLSALKQVIGEKLAQNQVAIPTLETSLPHFMGEIIAASRAEAVGAQIQQISVTVQIDNPSAVQAYSGPLPPDPMTSAANAYKQAAQEQLDPRNYDYAAQVNVGGFKLKASTDGGFDTDGLKSQVKDKVKTEIIWYGIGCAVIGLVLVGLAGLGWYIYGTATATGPSKGPAKAAAWDGKSTFSCGGNDSVKLEGVTASIASGTAIRASGNCRLELVNVNVTAPDGIEALSNAVVTVTGGSINATGTAAKALGSAQITFSGTTVKGKTKALGGAKITGP